MCTYTFIQVFSILSTKILPVRWSLDLFLVTRSWIHRIFIKQCSYLSYFFIMNKFSITQYRIKCLCLFMHEHEKIGKLTHHYLMIKNINILFSAFRDKKAKKKKDKKKYRRSRSRSPSSRSRSRDQREREKVKKSTVRSRKEKEKHKRSYSRSSSHSSYSSKSSRNSSSRSRSRSLSRSRSRSRSRSYSSRSSSYDSKSR